MPKIKARTFALIRWLVLLIVLVGSAEAQIPKLDYASYLGGSGDESGYAVATDSMGAVYIAGFTTSPDLPVVNSLQRYYGGGTGDLFVAKLKPDGSGFAYITYIGGSGGEGDRAGYVGGIAVDAQGNAYVTGITRSADFPTTPGAFQPAIGSKFICDSDPNAGLCGDAFVLKLSSDGSRLIYSTFLGGSDYDDAKAIAIDTTGAAYVTGMTASPDFPTTSGAFQSQLIDVDAYVAKVSPDGALLLYSTLIGGTGFDAGMAIAVDSAGRAYVAGTTQASDFPLKSALQATFGDPWDGFVLRLNAAGTDLEFSTYLGGQGTQQALGIALDSHDDIYVAGYTDSADFPIKNAFQPSYGGGATNGFVTKIRNDGSAIVYSTFFGGSDGGDKLNAIAVDAVGSAYVAGQGGPDFPVVSGLLSYRGMNDAVVAKLSPDGSRLLYSTFAGGSGADAANGIALDPLGRIVLTGQTSSSDFPVTAGAFQTNLRGTSDAFVVRLTESAAASPLFSAPREIAIGAAYVGQWSGSQSIQIANVGASSLIISSLIGSSNVKVTTSCVTIQPGTACPVSLAILPSVLGDQSGTITVYDNAPDSPQTITVHATGVSGGDLELASLVTGGSFSYYGRTAVPVTATIVNHGPGESGDVTAHVTSGAGSANCDPCYVGTIRTGNSAVLRFNFIPSVYGMIPMTVQIKSTTATPDLNASNDSRTIAVANPRYVVSPAQLTFANQPVNVASAAQRITFISLDQQPLQLAASVAGDFYATLSCDQGALRCYADVSFQPVASGSRTGTLLVTEMISGTTQTISLTGSAILAPHARLSDAALTFVAGVPGTATPPRVITVSNDGSASLFLLGITVSGSFFQTDQCPPSLMPAESCNIAVSFLASQAGTISGTLTITDNTSNRVEMVSLTGTGIPLVSLVRPDRGVVTLTSSAPLSPAAGSIQPVRPNGQPTTQVPSARSTSSATASGLPSRPMTRFGGPPSLLHSGIRGQ